jgi:hypothetical protein
MEKPGQAPGFFVNFLRMGNIRQISTLAAGREHLHIGAMSKSPRVTFQPKRIAEGDWQIEAHCPGEDIRYISGLTSKADMDDWMQGSRKIAWLRSQGYAK